MGKWGTLAVWTAIILSAAAGCANGWLDYMSPPDTLTPPGEWQADKFVGFDFTSKRRSYQFHPITFTVMRHPDIEDAPHVPVPPVTKPQRVA